MSVMMVPEGWELLRLLDIGQVITGNTPSTEHEEYYRGIIPFIGPVDFRGQKYIDEAEKNVSELGLLQSRKIPRNTIMTVCIGSTIGKIAIAIKDSCTNQQINSLACTNQFNSEYIFYAMSQYLQKQLDVEAGLQAVPIVNKSSFSKLLLPCPMRIAEQQKIASILSTLDRTIEATQKLIDKEKMVKKGLMADLLTHGIDEQGRIRSPQTHTYIDSPLGMIPKGWEVNDFSHAGIQLIDGDRGSNYPSEYDFSNSEYCLFLSAKNVTKNGFRFEVTQFITQDKDSQLSKGKLLQGDIVLTTRGTVGNLAYYDESIVFQHIRINSGMLILRNTKELQTLFLYHQLKSFIFDTQIERVVFGSAQPQLTVKEVNKFLIKIPTAVEQQKITAILSAQDRKIETEETNLAKLRNLKKGLMGDLLSGDVRVK